MGGAKMNFSYTSDQTLIKESAREFLVKECPSELVREMEEDDKGFPPALWQKIADMGWLGLLLPEKYGGMGPAYFDLIVLLEEMGRHLVPVPLVPTVILGGSAIFYGGSEEQKQEILPRIVSGELMLTLALTELQPAYDPTAIELWANRQGDYFILDGIKLFIPYAHVADYLVCAARTKPGDSKEDGITLFLVSADQPNIKYTTLKTLDCGKQCEVVLDHVELMEEQIIGEYNRGWEILKIVLEQATVAQCALMVGGAERVLEMTVAHAKARNQFGRPIGSFQAVQHRCSNMKVDLEGARFATYEAASKIDKGFPAPLEVSVAKAWANQACNRICDSGHQIHGGSGIMKDYSMELYSRRIKGAEFFLGDTQYHKKTILKQLGL
jgi:alkylation response protein AidB-like acyl-CoA dehydrogenase